MLNTDEYCGVVGGETKKRRSSKNKRRFSDEQIRSLELMFESESRLEQRKKLQLALDLGLQPRQVAIWFQNKRARWKSKQLEQDYNLLRANYNSLASNFQALKKEKQALVLHLNELVNKAGGEQGREVGTASATNDGESENGKPPPQERWEEAAELFGVEMEQEEELMSMADASMTSSEDWCSLESDPLFDESRGSYQWWDFWS